MAAITMFLGALVNLTKPGHYIHWHFITISVANVEVIALMVIVFIAALLLPTGHKGGNGS